MWRVMTPHAHKPADDDEACLDATVDLEPPLIEAEPRQALADRPGRRMKTATPRASPHTSPPSCGHTMTSSKSGVW
jgi:hypothetical protein